MNLAKVLAELHEERRRIEETILVFTRLAAGGGRRRGRPPKWMAELAPKRDRPPGRKGMSKAARKAQSARMKKYWAAKRKAKS